MSQLKDVARDLGKRIALLRRMRGMTAEALARLSGISRGYLSDLENGNRLPSLPMLVRLARSLGVPIRRLF